jgi:5'-3' exonuclease
MLALATHEPHFRVLREDVFNESNSNACRKCGQEGHYAAQCTGTPAEVQKKPPPEKKPFIFLDVSILREYLEVELEVPSCPFSLEQAIDDWVLLIFFVGNDFLPHLPSLEIREGAIDTLLKIWKQELPRMGGYITNHGELVLSRAEIILEGLAQREDEIFRRRREGMSHAWHPASNSIDVKHYQLKNVRIRMLKEESLKPIKVQLVVHHLQHSGLLATILSILHFLSGLISPQKLTLLVLVRLRRLSPLNMHRLQPRRLQDPIVM